MSRQPDPDQRGPSCPHRTVCKLPECDRAHYCRGLCRPHYRQWNLYGDVDAWPPAGTASPRYGLAAEHVQQRDHRSD